METCNSEVFNLLILFSGIRDYLERLEPQCTNSGEVFGGEKAAILEFRV